MIHTRTVAALILAVACQSEAGELSRHPLATLQQDLRIGSVDARDYFLTYVGDLEVSDVGTIYVVQLMQQTMKVYDSTGTFVRRIGRMGGGPGEFQAPLWMGWIGDTLWVYDGPRTHLSLFGASGDFIRNVRYGRHGDAALLADGTVAFRPFSLGSVGERVLLRLFIGSEKVDTLAYMEMMPGEGWNPFRDDPLWKAAPGGSYFVIVERRTSARDPEPRFLISKIEYTGDTLWQRSFLYDPIPLTDDIIAAVVDPLVERRNQRNRSQGRPLIQSSDVRDELYIPETVPPVSRVVIGYDESMWLNREYQAGDTTKWDVLSAEGDHKFSIVIPSGTRILRATESTVWAAELDELDVPYVVRYRIHR